MPPEEIRKQEWLSEEVGEVGHSHVPLCARSADKYGLDLDEFKMKSGRKGKDFKECVKVAEWICIDEMRGLRRPQFFVVFSRRAVCISFARAATCTSQRGWTSLRLELWYDDLHFQKWKDKNNEAPPRK